MPRSRPATSGRQKRSNHIAVHLTFQAIHLSDSSQTEERQSWFVTVEHATPTWHLSPRISVLVLSAFWTPTNAFFGISLVRRFVA